MVISVQKWSLSKSSVKQKSAVFILAWRLNKHQFDSSTWFSEINSQQIQTHNFPFKQTQFILLLSVTGSLYLGSDLNVGHCEEFLGKTLHSLITFL